MSDTQTNPIQRTRAPRPFGIIFWLSLAWIVAVTVSAVLADVLPLRDPLKIDVSVRLFPPSQSHWFGTDGLGRDMFSRAIYGSRVSIGLALLVPPIGVSLGLLIGTIAAYYRGPVDRLIISAIDSYLAFPGLVLLLALITFLGASVFTLFGLFCLGMTVGMSRLARANALSLVEREFVLAARGLGASSRRIILKELVPNVALPLIAWSPLLASGIIAVEGALSFLGLSVAPPTPTWGNMIEEGRTELTANPHVSMVPIGMLFLTVLALNLVGDGLRQRLDVRGSRL